MNRFKIPSLDHAGSCDHLVEITCILWREGKNYTATGEGGNGRTRLKIFYFSELGWPIMVATKLRATIQGWTGA
jgi:hypothetical protein